MTSKLKLLTISVVVLAAVNDAAQAICSPQLLLTIGPHCLGDSRSRQFAPETAISVSTPDTLEVI